MSRSAFTIDRVRFSFAILQEINLKLVMPLETNVNIDQVNKQGITSLSNSLQNSK